MIIFVISGCTQVLYKAHVLYCVLFSLSCFFFSGNCPKSGLLSLFCCFLFAKLAYNHCLFHSIVWNYLPHTWVILVTAEIPNLKQAIFCGQLLSLYYKFIDSSTCGGWDGENPLPHKWTWLVELWMSHVDK